MKGWLVFIAGLLIGGAGGLLVAAMGGREDPVEGAGGRGDGRRIASGSAAGYADGSPRGRQSGRSGSSGRGLGGSPKGPANSDDLLGYLETLKVVDDLEEVNFMQLLRHGSFITNLTEREVTDLIAVLEAKSDEEDGGGGDLSQIFSALLFSRMAELDGPKAMRMILEGELGERWKGDEDELMAVGIGSWVDADPVGASRWFREVGLSNPKMAALLGDRSVQKAFFASMARHDTRQAMSLALEAGNEAASRSMEVIARYEQSPERLAEMLGQSSGKARLEVFRIMSERDPGAAVGWLEAQSGLADQDGYVEAVAGPMMENDPEGGIDWYMQQELTAEGVAERYERIAGHLAEGSPAAAAEWLGAQPDAPERDRAEADVARTFAGAQDWEASFGWAAMVGNDQLRERTVSSLIRRGWDRHEKRMNPELAEAARGAGFGAQLDAYLEREGGGR